LVSLGDVIDNNTAVAPGCEAISSTVGALDKAYRLYQLANADLEVNGCTFASSENRCARRKVGYHRSLFCRAFIFSGFLAQFPPTEPWLVLAGRFARRAYAPIRVCGLSDWARALSLD
jgi:hypothetical protein